MKASILITSYNRPELLSFGLDSLASQSFSNDDVEIIVLNDGDPDDGTEAICELFEDDLNIRYFAAKQRKDWRVPGFAINFGVKQCRGKYIFISCAEMYHLDESVLMMLGVLDRGNEKTMVIPSQGKDDDGSYLEYLKGGALKEYSALPRLHNVHLPFFMGINKSEFEKIGGYDEDLIGMGYDDNDIVERLKSVGNKHFRVNCRIIHLHHARLNNASPEIIKKFNYNKKVYSSRRRKPVRNPRGWGNSF